MNQALLDSGQNKNLSQLVSI